MEMITELCSVEKPTSLALGFFDGVHQAHAAVIGAAVDAAGNELVPSVLTFRTGLERPENKLFSKNILTEEQKLERFAALGVKQVFLPEFSDFSGMEAERFVRDILFDCLRAKVLTCGYDYSFGKGASGRVTLLRQLCEQAGVTLLVQAKCCLHDQTISATAVREFLLAGDIPSANDMLGYSYYILGRVVHGKSLGRTLGFPTLNQPFPAGQLVPKYGVYNSVTEIKGKRYKSITNIGVKPSIEGERTPLAETYLLGGEGDFYGEIARVFLMEMTRPEQKFQSLEELKAAVLRDIAARG